MLGLLHLSALVLLWSIKASAEDTNLADCLGDHDVPVSLISSPNFAQLAKPYNVRLAYTPAVIVLPTTIEHISEAVKCAAQCNVKVQVS